MERDNLLEIRDLAVEYHTDEAVIYAINHVDLSIKKGETIGLVGETGAGKTSIARSILGILPMPPAKIISGEIIFEGNDVLKLSEREMRKIRGNKVAMIFQDPMTALNPIETIGYQISETILQHNKISNIEAHKRACDMLEMVGIEMDRFKDFPHQFSGGMKQRVVIAIALACNPELLLADEPTTALDVTIQAQVLEMMQSLKDKLETSVVMITHDLGVVAGFCDSVAVVYAGEIVERGPVESIFDHAEHPYTLGLFGSLPKLNATSNRLNPIKGLMPDPTRLADGCRFAERCPRARAICSETAPKDVEIAPGHIVRCFFAGEGRGNEGFGEVIAGNFSAADAAVGTGAVTDIGAGADTGAGMAVETALRSRQTHLRQGADKAGALLEVRDLKKYFKTNNGMLHAVDGINFTLNEGKTLGVVGESGCGKSTLGRTILHLLDATDGQVFFDGKDITDPGRREIKKLRERMQIIFQDPYSSLDPRKSVSEAIMTPLIMRGGMSKNDMRAETRILMDTVGLASRFENSYPHELDGGRRQRIGIARALSLKPKFIVCDEPVSALDVSIQAQIINLMLDLQEERGLAYMFVTHDLSVVKYISDDIMVMYLGQMVEKAPSDELFRDTRHPYTMALLSAIPVPDIHNETKRILLHGELTSPINPKPGCRFAARCRYAAGECSQMQTLEECSPGHFVACCRYKELA